MVHLKLNTMHKESKTLSEKVKEKLKHFLWADYLLYDHFKSKLQREIKRFGQEKVEKLKNEIVALSEQLSEECLEEPKEDNGWLHVIKAKPEKTWNQANKKNKAFEINITVNFGTPFVMFSVRQN